ncbi:MAG TPA: heavy-metal-associated domain-containing protein [Gammaproteobacteria bacterium]|nr:heavy-metal-associated domain-containing protein [Gammaproteobacteria bacterium]
MLRLMIKLAGLFSLSLGLIAVTPAFAAPANTGSHPNAYVLQVDGLACPFCAYGIEKEFSRQLGVENTNVNLANGVLIVTVKPGTRFSDAQLKQVVHAAGFVLKAVVSRPTGKTS